MIIKDQLELFCKVKINIQLISFILKKFAVFQKRWWGATVSVYFRVCQNFQKAHFWE